MNNQDNLKHNETTMSFKLSLWKNSLLDTSKRNKMINYKATKRSTLKIIEPSIKELFNKLAIKETILTFKRPIDKKFDVRTYYMLSLLENLSYKIPVHIGDIKTSSDSNNQEKTLKNLRQRAKLAQEEQGINILYLSFGFIEWKDFENNSSQIMKSPLLMMPVRIGLKSLNAPYTLSKDDDEIEVNPTLKYIYNQKCGINLPEFQLQNGESLEKYFEEIEKLVDKKGWRLIREVSLDIMQFSKISMYHDLDENEEKLVNNPIIKAICGERNAITSTPKGINDLNLDDTRPEEWYEIMDSDSSQGKAIYLSRKNYSFVMQGPPGTGKSQTITNIIAQALGEGKKVLFVAEKTAALDVVLKRLTEVGLNKFCLSLHNHKVNKKEIIKDITSNLNLEYNLGDNDNYISFSNLMNTRRYLNSYVEELHKKISPFNESVYEIYGKLTKLNNIKDINFNIANILNISKDDYFSFLNLIETFETSLKNLGGKISDIPWKDIDITTVTDDDKNKLISNFQQFLSSLKKLKDFDVSFEEKYSSRISRVWNKISVEIQWLEMMLKLPKYYLSIFDDSKKIKNLLERAIKEKDDADLEKIHSQKMLETVKALKAKWNVEKLSLTLNEINFHFLKIDNIANVLNVKNCNELLDKIKGIIITIQDMLKNYQLVNNSFKLKGISNFNNIKILSELLKILSNAPKFDKYLLNIDKIQDYKNKIEELKNHQNILNKKLYEISKNWSTDIFNLDVEAMLERFITDYAGVFFYRFNKDFKNDMKNIIFCSKSVISSFSKNNAIELLIKLKNINAEKKWFSDNQNKYEEFIPTDFKGIETDCDKILNGLDATLAISKLFEYFIIPKNVQEAIINIQDDNWLISEIKKYSDLLGNEKIQECKNFIKSLDINFDDEVSINDVILVKLELLIVDINKKINFITSFKKSSFLEIKDIRELVNLINDIKVDITWFEQDIPNIFTELNINNSSDYIRDNIENAKIIAENYMLVNQKYKSNELNALFDVRYDGNKTNWQSIINDIKDFETLRNGNNFDNLNIIRNKLLNDFENEDLKKDIVTITDKLKVIIDDLSPKMDYISNLFPKNNIKNISLDEVEWKLYLCLENISILDNWLECKRVKSECDKNGLKGFTDKIFEYDNTINDIQKVFEKGFYQKLLSSAINALKLNSINVFNSAIYTQKLNNFISHDVSLFKLSRSRIYNNNVKNFPQKNIFTGLDSEVKVLTHENDKRSRVMPIRKLFSAIPNLLLTLKPCLMMSPLSVAHFLNADKFKFDIVIFDEASQIFPEDAIGAILRGKQIIVAGDTNQLPPTNFFLSNSNLDNDEYDDEDEYFDDEIYDSILEETVNVLPNITLLWHYRSRYERLIAFSNKEIYQNELITFPSNNENNQDAGVEFVYVKDGEYISGGKNCNIAEAKKCVELIKEHITKYPNRSLGVIAFSSRQQDVILQEVQKFREENQQYENFFSEDREEAFFVKNLENVQGDERDTIFFSICYAKTKEQKEQGKAMALRFGPLGRVGGEKRLNVAITRARINIKLVSSIQPEDININKTESIGVRMLRSYIEFAKNNLNYNISRENINVHDDLVDTVYQFLLDSGYNVKRNIGYSNCRIDLAIENPERQGEFVMGIECDGKNYASSVTARDRFRLRGSVLANMGWKLYHIWSKEWYNNQQVVKENLKKFIDAEIKNLHKNNCHKETKVEILENVVVNPELINKNSSKIEIDGTEAIQNDQKDERINNINDDINNNKLSKNMNINSNDDLYDILNNEGFKCVDNRKTSEIIWVIYEERKKSQFELLSQKYNLNFKLYKRGPIATNYKPAWVIFIKGKYSGKY